MAVASLVLAVVGAANWLLEIVTSLLWLCFTLSGAAALALELLWMRSAALVLGATAATAATVLACYFAGLGLGARGAREAPARPVRRYGVLELRPRRRRCGPARSSPPPPRTPPSACSAREA